MQKKLVFKTVMVTPKMAETWLAHNESNRGLSDSRVESYARDMENGKWQLNPQGIVLNGRGNVLDGQHRLAAVIRYGKPVQMVVCSGAPHSVREVIDRGRGRTLADYLRMNGVSRHVVLTAAVARGLHHLDGGVTYGVFTINDAKGVMKEYAAEFEWLDSALVISGLARGPYLASVLWSLALGERVDKFHHSVMTGENLKAKSPEIALRNILLSMKKGGSGGLTTIDIYLKTLNCIAAAVDGESIQRNVYPSTIGYKRVAKLLGKKITDGNLLGQKARVRSGPVADKAG
jgi:hypothetical protein